MGSRTRPFLCKASDGNLYFVKGYAASVAGLMKDSNSPYEINPLK
jgi:hypothetical protein